MMINSKFDIAKIKRKKIDLICTILIDIFRIPAYRACFNDVS